MEKDKIYSNFDEIHKEILTDLNNQKYTLNKRTGVKVKEKFGVSFKWNLSFFPISNIKKTYTHIAASELAWSLSGEKSISWLKKYTSIWDKFANSKGEVETAYDFRWTKEFGINQITNIISKLKKDPSSRQQILMFWNPRTDNIQKFPNLPCPFAIVFGITDNKLNMHLSVRSNDMVCGFPYDIMMYVMLGSMAAKELKVKKGILFYSIANYHYYQTHESIINKILKLPTKNIIYPNDFSWSYKQILKNKDKFVENYKQSDKNINTEWQFSEKAEIVL